MKKHKHNEPNVLQELKEISPFLASLEKSHPFRVPNGYFEAMEQAVLGIVRAESNPETKTNLSVPNNYFEELPQQILNKVSARDHDLNVRRVVPFRANYQLLLAAASVALIAGLYFLFFSSSSLQGPADPFTKIQRNHQSAESYLYANLDEVDEATLIQMLVEEEDNGAVNSELTESDYEEYLMDLTDVDPELLIEI